MSQRVPYIPDDAPFSTEQRAWLNGFLAGLYSTAEPSLAQAPAPSFKVAVLFATQSGTSERLAKKLAKELSRSGHAADLVSLNTFSPIALSEQTHALVIASTYGDGDPPDGAQSFFEALSLLSAPRLDNLRYAVFALGDPSYEHFCKFGADLDARFYSLGGTRLCERIDCGNEVEETFEQWKTTVLGRLSASAPPTDPGTSAGSQRSAVSSSKPPVHTRENPYLAEVIEKRALTQEVSSKLTVHMSISLAGSDLHYEAGDACGIFAQNDPAIVEEVLAITNFSPDATVNLPRLGCLTLLDALTNHLQMSRLTRKLVQGYATLGDCSRLQQLLAPEAQKQLDTYMFGRGLIDLLEECPDVLETPAQLAELLPKLSTRLYSISSSPAFHTGELHTTVAVVRYRSHDRERAGVCSTMLSDRTPLGSRVPIYIHPNRRFRLPADPATPIIMIGPGTGIAPFRSFLHERRALGATGRNWLFFGDRNAATDFLYRDELESMRADGHLTRLSTAFSRDQESRIYVQDRMAECGAEFWRWLNDGASLYVCGDASRMASDVDTALHSIVEQHGSRDAEGAKDFVQQLHEQNRYQRDVY